jgi:hypothetical protein
VHACSDNKILWERRVGTILLIILILLLGRI